MDYEENVFISYSSEDAPWAAKLEGSLKTALIKKVYRDKNRLLPGAKWEDELMTKVRASQHLVILWSANSNLTDWVRRERGNFEAAIATPARGEGPANRLMIFVRLDDEDLANASLQVINNIKEAKAYAEGADNIDPKIWQAVIDQIVSAIQNLDDSIPVPTAVLAATYTEIESLPPATLDALVKDLGIGSNQALFDRYKPLDPLKPKRTDWKPFGSSDSIERVLDRQQARINAVTADPKFRLDYVKDEFWTDIQTARRYADTMREHLSLIVIDPISLAVDIVYRRANLLKKCLANSETAVMVSTPFSLSRPFLRIRELIKDNGSPFFDEYFLPPVHDMTLAPPAAALGIYVGDEEDTERLLLAAMAPYVRKSKSGAIAAYIKTRGGI